MAYDEEERVGEWLVHQNDTNAMHEDSDDEVFPGEQLTWRQVAKIMGANPKRRKSSRMMKSVKKTKGRTSTSTSKSKELRRNDEVHEEDEDILSSSDSSSSDEEDPNIPLDYDISPSESEHGEED